MSAGIPIAVVGTGFGARIQVPGFKLSRRFTVVALVGRRPERTRDLAERLGVPLACTSVEEALSLPGLAAVSIATPPATHAPYAIAAATRGLHVLCEKPMARTVDEAEAMVAAAAASGVVALVDHEFRFHPSRATLARLIARGDLGTPRIVTVHGTIPLYVNPYRAAPAWWFDAAAGGGWLGASGSHAIDTVRFWLGEVTAVSALVDSFAPADGVAAPADDAFALLLRTASGAQGIVAQNAVTWGPRQHVLSVTGSKATAWIDDRWRLWCAVRDGDPVEVPVPPELRLPDVDVPESAGPFAAHELPAFVRLAERFADAIEGRPPAEPAPARFADGLAVQRVIDAARASARSGTSVRLA